MRNEAALPMRTSSLLCDLTPAERRRAMAMARSRSLRRGEVEGKSRRMNEAMIAQTIVAWLMLGKV
jgi:hypothetical protein